MFWSVTDKLIISHAAFYSYVPHTDHSNSKDNTDVNKQ